MGRLLNQHSYLLAVALALVLTVFLVLQYLSNWWGLVAVIPVFLFLVLIHVALRTGGSSMQSVEAVEMALKDGKPTLMEVFSDF